MPNEEAIQKMSIVDPIQVNVNIPNFEGKPGRDGTDGRDGDDAYRIAVRNGFLGTEKEWLLTLKGQDGKSASAPTARQALLNANVWCEDDTVDSVFNAIIGNWGKPMPRTDFKPLRLESNPIVGVTDLMFGGEPHFKIRVNGNDFELDSNGMTNVTVPSANTGDSYTVEYFSFVNKPISSTNVSFGDLSGIFKKGNLIETKEFDINSYMLVVSIYDNKVIELGTQNNERHSIYVDKDVMKRVKDYVVTKISDIDTVIFDSGLLIDFWSAYGYSVFEEIAIGIGHGVNMKLDLSGYQSVGYANTTRGEKLSNRVSDTDRHIKNYIGKAIQVGDSNIVIVKNNNKYLYYDYNSHSIQERDNS